jgi:predicted RNA polymerase sigma factor
MASIVPGPMFTLNRIVALAMVHGPSAGLVALDAAQAVPALTGHYCCDAVRAYLLDLAGDHDAARVHYGRAAKQIKSP